MSRSSRNTEQILRWPEVEARAKISRPTAWRLERLGQFPARRRLSGRAVGWVESEIAKWIRTRSRG